MIAAVNALAVIQKINSAPRVLSYNTSAKGCCEINKNSFATLFQKLSDSWPLFNENFLKNKRKNEKKQHQSLTQKSNYNLNYNLTWSTSCNRPVPSQQLGQPKRPTCTIKKHSCKKPR